MPVLDISQVSDSLLKLVKKRVTRLIIDNQLESGFTEQDLIVLLLPPDQLSGKGKYVIGLYLYHLSEDSHFQNPPNPAGENLALRYTPMGLNLYYQITANSDPETDLNVSVEREQLLMGLAVKTLRDYPSIDKSTTINSESILADELQEDNDRLRIVLQPTAPNEAVSFWTAGSTPLRLASYYQVSVVLLEPDITPSRTGRVLSYGAYAFPGEAPRLEGSQNVLFYRLFGGGDPHSVELQPAEAPFVATVPEVIDDKKNGDVTFKGSGLTGYRTSFLIRSSNWDESLEVDAAWNVIAKANVVTATVQPEIVTPSSTVQVMPGMHSAMVKVTNQRAVSVGAIREFEQISNATPFVITPRIDSITDPTPFNPASVVEVKGWRFKYTDEAGVEQDLPVEMYVLDIRLTKITGAAPAVGEFKIVDRQTVSFVRPTGIDSTAPAPLRILVNGAESAPNWIAMS